MNENDNLNQNSFDGIPALDDTAGLQNFLNAENLKAAGIQNPAPAPTPAPAVTPTVDNIQGTQPAAAPAQGLNTGSQSLSQNDLQAVMQKIDEITARLNNQAQPQVQPQIQPQVQPQGNAGYTQQQRAFINESLARGYSLEQIQKVLAQRTNPQQNAMEQRMAQIENYLKTQEYQQAESAFINKLSTFGEKWGLSENDLVTFGNAALAKGINIAMPNTDLETVFRAVYPEQYAIRSQRMTPTNTSQIYGGTSIPEGNRVQAAQYEDAYVDQFLRQSMPNQYNMLNKK